MSDPIRKSGVYLITCLPTGEMYVGATIWNVNARLAAHRGALRAGKSGCTRLQAAYNKHGPDAFEYRLLNYFPPEEVYAREREAVRKLRPALNSRLVGTCHEAKSTNHVYEVRGEHLTVNRIAEKYGLKPATVYQRAHRGVRDEALIRGAARGIKL